MSPGAFSPAKNARGFASRSEADLYKRLERFLGNVLGANVHTLNRRNATSDVSTKRFVIRYKQLLIFVTSLIEIHLGSFFQNVWKTRAVIRIVL